MAAIQQSSVAPARVSPGYRPFGIFRLMLAILVMVQHFGVVASPYVGRVLAVPATGNIAVLTFFVLSGFIITESAERFYPGRPGAFVTNRAIRILPPYLCAVLLSIGAHFLLYRTGQLALWPPLADLPHNLFFTPGSLFSNVIYPLPVVSNIVGEPDYRFIPYAWAVRVELLFYCVIAAALAATPFFKSFAKILGGLSIVMLLIYFLWRMGLAPSMTRMVVYFGLGVSMYFAVKGSAKATIIALIFGGLALFDYYDYDAAQRTEFFTSNPSHHRLAIVEYMLLVSCMGAIPLLAKCRPGSRLQKIDAKLGGLSYSLYLNQYVAIVIVNSVFINKGYWTLFLAVILAFVLAYVMNVIVEKNTEPLRTAIRGFKLEAA
ncbi:acyltransferase [Caulobacter segnis]|nr:acyltransferase [Caulobacter segnis]